MAGTEKYGRDFERSFSDFQNLFLKTFTRLIRALDGVGKLDQAGGRDAAAAAGPDTSAIIALDQAIDLLIFNLKGLVTSLDGFKNSIGNFTGQFALASDRLATALNNNARGLFSYQRAAAEAALPSALPVKVAAPFGAGKSPFGFQMASPFLPPGEGLFGPAFGGRLGPPKFRWRDITEGPPHSPNWGPFDVPSGFFGPAFGGRFGPPAPPAPAAAGAGAGEAAGGAAEAGGGLLGTLGSVGMAAIGVVAAFSLLKGISERLFGAMETWTTAFSPALIDTFHRALADLSATLGQAFTPLFGQLIPAVREFASILQPAMMSLQPVVADLTSILVTLLTPAVRLIADGLQFLLIPIKILMPALQIFAEIVSSINEVASVLMKIVLAIGQAFAGLLVGGIDLKDMFRALRDATKEIVRQIVLFTTRLFLALGWFEALDRLEQLLQPVPGAMAQGSFQYRDLQSIGRDLALAAAQAVPGGQGREGIDMTDILAEMRQMRQANLDRMTSDLERLVNLMAWLSPGGLPTMATEGGAIYRGVESIWRAHEAAAQLLTSGLQGARDWIMGG